MTRLSKAFADDTSGPRCTISDMYTYIWATSLTDLKFSSVETQILKLTCAIS